MMQKNRHLRTIAKLSRAESLQLRHASTIGKKLVKQQYLLHTYPQYGELRPTSSWNLFGSLGHPSKFQRVSRLGFITAATSLTGGQPNFARCLIVSWAATLYINFWGLLAPDGILPSAKFTLRPNLTFSYIGSITAQHFSIRCQPNFVVFNRGRHLYSAGRPSIWASAHILIIIIIRPHHHTTQADAAYCYRTRRVVCRSVCHSSEPSKNGWTDRDAICL